MHKINHIICTISAWLRGQSRSRHIERSQRHGLWVTFTWCSSGVTMARPWRGHSGPNGGCRVAPAMWNGTGPTAASKGVALAIPGLGGAHTSGAPGIPGLCMALPSELGAAAQGKGRRRFVGYGGGAASSPYRRTQEGRGFLWLATSNS